VAFSFVMDKTVLVVTCLNNCG